MHVNHATRAILPAVALCLSSVIGRANPALVLHEGTPLRMKIDRTISSGSARTGETVDFQTLDDIKLGEDVVIPRGSTAIGTITEAVAKRHMGKGGKLNLNIDYVRMPNGDKLALRGVQELKGGGHGGVMAGGMLATAVVFWPAAPLFLLVHGKDISVPKGHEVTVYTNSDYSDPSVAARAKEPKVASSPLRSGAALSNRDVLTLKQAGLSDDLILAKVRASNGLYNLGVDDLLHLKAAGLSDLVIGEMIATSAR